MGCGRGNMAAASNATPLLKRSPKARAMWAEPSMRRIIVYTYLRRRHAALGMSEAYAGWRRRNQGLPCEALSRHQQLQQT